MTRTRHPISLARRVMEKSPHVMLVGAGADTFSREQGLEQVEPGWFYTERRWQSLEKTLKEKGLPIPPKPAGITSDAAKDLVHDEGKQGTVGVVALDANGNVAAGTSTGGHDGQALGPGRRLADHRRGHVRVEHLVRGVGDGDRRILHPPHGGARDLRAGRVQGT